MPKHRKSRKVRVRLHGAALSAARAPMKCREQLSHCMTGGGRRKAGMCMRAFHACTRK